jgi:hypothetical protein
MKPFKVNADYEVELFHNKLAPPAINQSIEFILFFLSSHPLYTQKEYSSEYLNYIEKRTNHIPEIVKAGSFENFWGPLKNKELEKWWNSKITSTELIINQGWCADTHIIKNEDNFKTINWSRDLLLKDPFGMSGQKFQLLLKKMSLSERQEMILKAIASGPVIIEPWFNRLHDFSQYIFPDGKLIAYQNQVDEKFQYKGTIFNNLKSSCLQDLSFYKQVSEEKWSIFQVQTQAIIDFYSQHSNEYGYSIDSFIYEEEGELKIRVMSEINYRRTMGRLTYELSEKFSNDRNWTALLMMKKNPLVQPLWQRLSSFEGMMVLSPGDSRFEIILLTAENKNEGLKLIEKLNALLPYGKFTVKL